MIGVCDTQTRDRLGPAAAWLEHATHIAVYDHHEFSSTDLEPDELTVEPVGSVTTLLVEKLRVRCRASAAAPCRAPSRPHTRTLTPSRPHALTPSPEEMIYSHTHEGCETARGANAAPPPPKSPSAPTSPQKHSAHTSPRKY